MVVAISAAFHVVQWKFQFAKRRTVDGFPRLLESLGLLGREWIKRGPLRRLDEV
jgi:hypothetical protein